MADRSLDVWLNEWLVGRLDQEGGRLQFTYEAAWLAHDSAVPLSVSLPLRAESYDDRASRPFFAGLLPEQEKRDQVARALGVSPRNDFALLDGVGGECAGAVTFTHPGEKPVEVPADADYRFLDDKQLAEVLAKIPDRPFLAGEKDIRLSLAGAQDKLPICLIQGRIALPLHGAPSSHIIKPPIRRIEGSVYNEGFCIALAKAIGLNVVEADIRHAGSSAYLLVRRYDREGLPPAHLVRMHQEDFCQALGIPPELKYENEGGPSLADCFALLRRTARPAALYLTQLLDTVIFNVLVGNHDAHGKNYSLIYSARDARLAPAYDVVCTAVYSELTDRMAMKIGGHYEFDRVMPRHWERFAKEAGLSAPLTRRRVLDMAERLPDAATAAQASIAEAHEAGPILARVVKLVTARCKLTRERFATG